MGNLVRVAKGLPLTTVPLGSMTLDMSDVEIARDWLSRRRQWCDTNVIAEFETAFAAWNGSMFAYSFMGGRVALSAALYALDLQPGDEVIVPGYTCVVVPNALRYAGVEPVYCDIELDTWGPDAESLEARVTPRTRAVLIHHLYGLVCRDYDAILRFARSRGLHVIEDCAHATGAVYQGVRVGNRGDIGFFSSEQSKVFNTSQGGMAVGVLGKTQIMHTHAYVACCQGVQEGVAANSGALLVDENGIEVESMTGIRIGSRG